MPIYEYKCKACGNEFEYQQRMSDPPKSECERCGGALEKLISRSSFMLKGSGWYKDLYSSAKPKSSGGDKADGSSTGGDKASSDSSSSGTKESSGSASSGSSGSSSSSSASGS
ncbi:FmdB family zinc ribbon protein [Haliangium sp.]|uniref:FmdB family zinc ribbon protein n=1 Tax=Haliangium sp. TaxID=2663208 RepID=UPI003D0BC485